MFNFDSEFIRKLKNKDKTVFNRFYLESVDIFFSYLKSHYNIDSSSIQDIISDFYVKLRDNIERYEEKNQFSAYIWTIFKNILKDWFKKTKESSFSDFNLKESIDFEDTLESEEDIIESMELEFSISEIKNFISKLSDMEQEIIFLKFEKELSYIEISKILNIGEDTARQRISRVVRKLKQLLSYKI